MKDAKFLAENANAKQMPESYKHEFIDSLNSQESVKYMYDDANNEE